MDQMDDRDESWYRDDQVLTTTTATGLTVSFTVGYVSWLLRAGYLSASLISTLPLWREFDPLPVLARTKEKKRRSGGRDKDSQETNDIESESIFTSSPSPETRNSSERDSLMTWFTPTRKVSFGLVMLTVSLLLLGDLIGVVPNEDRGRLEGRQTVL